MKTATPHQCFRILVDAREFAASRMTGIGRVLAGIVEAAALAMPDVNLQLAVGDPNAVSDRIRRLPNVGTLRLPTGWLASERRLTVLSRSGADLFLSPYPKLPLFGCGCPAIHTVHDVHDLTHPAYRRRLKSRIDRIRMRMALGRSDRTWFDSRASLEDTRRLVGTCGRNPAVRHLAVSDRFSDLPNASDPAVLERHKIAGGYILVVGNGLPHKNLGVLMRIGDRLKRELVFAGVPERNQAYWTKRFPEAGCRWIAHVPEDDLPAIYRGAFCLAQPSTAEGYGYPPLEAMASGVPAVVSDIPVLRETTGGAAVIVDPHASDEWLTGFAVFENPERRSCQVAGGKKWVDPFLGLDGWNAHVTDIHDLLERGPR